MTNIKPVIISFPGSNCEHDIERALLVRYHLSPTILWHHEHALPPDTTHVILPGGFSFGDYLRAGAIAAISPVMSAVKDFALAGMPVLGICNGFQILCEAKLLPGMLLRNHHDRFVCQTLSMTWHGGRKPGEKKLRVPIAHRDGRFFADEKTLVMLHEDKRIALTYDDKDDAGNAVVNGSLFSIAGIVGGPRRNILGLMPHPERALFVPRGSDGAFILDDFLYGETNEA